MATRIAWWVAAVMVCTVIACKASKLTVAMVSTEVAMSGHDMDGGFEALDRERHVSTLEYPFVDQSCGTTRCINSPWLTDAGGTEVRSCGSLNNVLVCDGNKWTSGPVPSSGVSSVTGAGSTSCSPTTGAVTCTTSNAVSNGLTGDTTLTAHGVLVGEGTSAIASVGGGTCSTGDVLLCIGGVNDPRFGCVDLGSGGACGTLPVGSGGANGGTGRSTLTAHAVILGEGTSAVNFAPEVASGDVLTDNGAGTDPTFQAPKTPSTIFSSVNHGGSVSLSGSYQALASLTLTASGTVDCTGTLTWLPIVAASGSLTINYGVSQDSTSAPTNARALAVAEGTQPVTLQMAGADVESYSATGSHTYRLLAETAASSGTISQNIAVGDLLCLTH